MTTANPINLYGHCYRCNRPFLPHESRYVMRQWPAVCETCHDKLTPAFTFTTTANGLLGGTVRRG